MPDLKRFNIVFNNVDINRDTIPYKDRAREKQRLKNLDNTIAKRKLERKKRKERYERETQRKKECNRRKSKLRKRKNLFLQSEWDELANETRLMKKLKKGKITKKEFEIQVGERTVDSD